MASHRVTGTILVDNSIHAPEGLPVICLIDCRLNAIGGLKWDLGAKKNDVISQSSEILSCI